MIKSNKAARRSRAQSLFCALDLLKISLHARGRQTPRALDPLPCRGLPARHPRMAVITSLTTGARRRSPGMRPSAGKFRRGFG